MSSFVHWVGSLFSGAGRAIKDVAKAAERAITGLVGELVAVFVPVKHAWGAMVKSAEAVGKFLGQTAQDVYDLGHYVLKKAIPNVVRWALRELAAAARKLDHAIAAVTRWAERELARLASELSALKKWVVKNVLDKVMHDVGAAVAFVAKCGATLADWIEHPEHLAALLVVPIYRAALAALRDGEQTIGKWIATSAMAAMVAAADVVEAILAAVV